MFLRSSTHPRWTAVCRSHLGALLSDHLHCERKAAENALGLVRRYPSNHSFTERLTRLAHEETAHLVQVTLLLAERGLTIAQDAPNRYTRALFSLVRGREPDHRIDALLCAGLIEARSHERLSLLATAFAADGETQLADFYRALGNAEERHAELFVDLAAETAPRAEVEGRLDELALQEAEILAALPFGPRVH
jgi:tRNA 2-(methylsulfanyl)-N6-isopentenyladenosine37 hydroxylase